MSLYFCLVLFICHVESLLTTMHMSLQLCMGYISSYSTAQIYVNCADALYTHIRVSIYAHTGIFIRTYAYVYTHIRVCLYAQTHIVIRTYAYMDMRIYAYTCESDVSLLFRTKTFLCVSLLWKRKSLKKQQADNGKLTYSTKLMAIMLQTHTSHRFKYLLNNEKKQFTCFIFCCWWIRTKRKMLLKLGI